MSTLERLQLPSIVPFQIESHHPEERALRERQRKGGQTHNHVLNRRNNGKEEDSSRLIQMLATVRKYTYIECIFFPALCCHRCRVRHSGVPRLHDQGHV